VKDWSLDPWANETLMQRIKARIRDSFLMHTSEFALISMYEPVMGCVPFKSRKSKVESRKAKDLYRYAEIDPVGQGFIPWRSLVWVRR
jgi:hypothetical protein